VAASLILCTKNGGARLGTCLAHLDALDAPPEFELVLVDNGSDDGESLERLRAFGASTRHPTTVLVEKRPGLSAARNAGLAAAKGDILLFTDDDCYADPGLVRDWTAVFADGRIGYGTGRILRFNPAHAMAGCIESPDPKPFPAGRFVPRGWLQGSNMAFRRACFDAIGRFDERLGAGAPFAAGEDWDMSIRAGFAGFEGGYFPEPTVWHDHRRTEADAVLRMRSYDIGAGAVLAKHLAGPHGARVAAKSLAFLWRNRRRPTAATTIEGMRQWWRQPA
jgi:glycosyltransferase involved in cell wall biosynthesis